MKKATKGNTKNILAKCVVSVSAMVAAGLAIAGVVNKAKKKEYATPEKREDEDFEDFELYDTEIAEDFDKE